MKTFHTWKNISSLSNPSRGGWRFLLFLKPKKGILSFSALLLLACTSTFAQLSDEEYAYITLDLQGILTLTMITDPQVNFAFTSIQDYQNGITRYNATKLEVDATVAWDLFAYASSDDWTQGDSYSANGESSLPAEILEMQAVNPNTSTPLGGTFNAFASLKGLSNSGVVGGIPNANNTQFLAGMVGTSAGESYSPGASEANPSTHQFRVHYRIVPGIPASFPNSTEPLSGSGFAQAGYYTLEVIYSLVEDL